MKRINSILLTVLVSSVAGLGVGAFVAGDEPPPVETIAPEAEVLDPVVTAPPGEPPYAEIEPPPADWEPTYPDEVLNDWQTDGYAVYGGETFPTTPEHDQCWRDDGGEILESGTFVIFDDGRTWGTHSIGAMRCGPADTPQPEPAPLTAQPAVAPVVESTTSSCEP